MSAKPFESRRDLLRVVVLWACLALFFLRVLGQIEVWLVAPEWLPDMNYWYSGVLPYPLLLPVQILLLMVMAVVAWLVTTRGVAAAFTRNRRRSLRIVGVLYFLAMALRLAVQIARGVPDLISAGAIPVAFHFVLALFILMCARPGCTRRAISMSGTIGSARL